MGNKWEGSRDNGDSGRRGGVEEAKVKRGHSPTLRIVGDQRGDVVEPVLASLQAQLPLVGLDQVMLDVRPLSRWQSNGQGHRVALTRLPDHEVL